MTPIEWIVAAVLLGFVTSTPLLYVAFPAVASYKRLHDSGVRFPVGMRLTAYALLAAGYPADMVFNALRGSVEFREFGPRELTFTARIQRHIDEATDEYRLRKAVYWAEVANAIEDGHVNGVHLAKERYEKLFGRRLLVE